MARPQGTLWSRDRPGNLWVYLLSFQVQQLCPAKGWLSSPSQNPSAEVEVQHCTALAQGSAVWSSCWFHVQTGRARGSGSCWRDHAHSQQTEEAQRMLIPPSQSTGEVGCGVLLCGCTIPAVTLVLDSDPLEPPLGGGWEC